jgi:hypothetical protein
MHLEHNGAMLPSVFRSVLYLDVFGWSSQVRLGGPSDVFLCEFTICMNFRCINWPNGQIEEMSSQGRLKN